MAEPKLRFKKDDGTEYVDWKVTTFDKEGTFTKGAALSKADISEEGTPFILYGELYTTYGEVANKIERKTEAEVESKYYSKVGDVIIPTSGETREDIATATCVMVPGVILAGDLNIYRSNDIDGRIISYITKHSVNKKISQIAQGKSVVHISADKIKPIEFSCPNDKEEQKKIAEFLSSVDELIATSEEEVANLEQQKKAAMQAIFSRKVRFKKEDGSDFPEWEEKQLCEVYDTRNGYTPSKANNEFWENGTIPWFRMEDIRENGGILYDAIQHITDKGVKRAGLFPAGTVIFATSATIGEHAILMVDSLSNQRFTALYPKKEYREKILPMFTYFMGFDLDEYCLNNQAHNTMASVSMDKFAEYPVNIPDTDEQRLIVYFLTSFDEAITAAKQELAKWKELKRGLLQQMFV